MNIRKEIHMSEFLKNTLEKIGYSLTDKQCEQFNTFHKLLCEWNEFMNLTGITDYEEVVIKHFMDSLAVNCVYNFSENEKVVDIGTGAGFPGIPLKIAYPDIRITLLDSLNKRINFLNEVIDKTSLNIKTDNLQNMYHDSQKVVITNSDLHIDDNNVETLHGRAEDYAKKKEYREQYDVCVSRAVANLATLSEYCIPFVKVGGVFISYKAGNLEEEINTSKNAIKLLGGKIEKVESIILPDTDIERTFVVIRKQEATKNKYPRKAGLPSKEPLK